MKSCWIVTRNNQSMLEMRDVPVPRPGRDEVLIRVHATALNRGELIVGSVVHGGPEKLGGTEAAGIIEAVGEGVTGWHTGDRVMGRARGTFAEYALMYQGQILPKPERLTWEQAAAVPSAFLTAYEAVVRYGRLQRGEWLLVAGASSGVGAAAVLTAKMLGAHTIGTSSSTAKLQKLQGLGMDAGIRTPCAEFSRQVIDITGGAGAQLAVNLVGGSLFPDLLQCLALEGRLAIVGYVDGVHQSGIDLTLTHLNRLQIFGISNARLTPEQRAQTTHGFKRDILPAIADGRIAPVVDRVFAFDELTAAKQHMETNAMTGKVVVRIS